MSHHGEIRAAEPLVAKAQQRLAAKMYELEGPDVADAARGEGPRHVLEQLVIVTRARVAQEQAQRSLVHWLGLVARGSSVRDILVDLENEARAVDSPVSPPSSRDPGTPPQRAFGVLESNVSGGHRDVSSTAPPPPPPARKSWPHR